MTTELNPALKLGDLIEQLESEIDRYEISTSEALARAYAAGADQELLACGNYLEKCAAWEPEDVTELYNYRRPRPKPPSLKEQAKFAAAVLRSPDETCSIAELQQHWHTICNALEQLND